MDIKKFSPKAQNEEKIIPKDNFQKYWLMLPAPIRVVLVIPTMTILFTVELIKIPLDFIIDFAKHRYILFTMLLLLCYSAFSKYAELVSTYGEENVYKAAKVLGGGILMIFILCNLWTIVALAFMYGICYFIYWAVMRALTGQ